MAEKLQRAPTLYGIIVFKLSKGLLLLLLAAGVYALSGLDIYFETVKDCFGITHTHSLLGQILPLQAPENRIVPILPSSRADDFR